LIPSFSDEKRGEKWKKEGKREKKKSRSTQRPLVLAFALLRRRFLRSSKKKERRGKKKSSSREKKKKRKGRNWLIFGVVPIGRRLEEEKREKKEEGKEKRIHRLHPSRFPLSFGGRREKAKEKKKGGEGWTWE